MSTPSLPLFLLAATCVSAFGRAQTLTFPRVAPADAATVEGSTGTAIPFGSSLARHVQYAYDGSVVGYATPMRIGAIELRADGATPGNAVAGTYTFALSCSTCPNAANALSTTFVNNHGADRVTVHTGSLLVPAPAVGAAPNDFSLRIGFTQPFEWDPRNGPLLLDFAYNISTPAFGVWDAVSSPGVGGVAALGSTTTTATSALTAVPAIRLLAAADVVPTSFATTAAPAGSAFPWGRPSGQPMRTLNLYEAAVMPPGGRRLITALAWRTDGGAAFPGRTYDIRISMSTSPRTAASISATFAANHGPDLTVVFDGTIVADPSPATTDAGRFQLFCELQQPFLYDPANGPLAIDVQLRDSTGTVANFNAASATPQVARISNTTDDNATTATSTQTGIALVMAMRSVPAPVLPLQLANSVNPTPANSTSFPWAANASRSLSMHSAAIAGITQPIFVRHLRFRPGASATTFGPSTYTCTIDLSNPTNTPATVSSTFDNNHGANRVRVFDGQFSVPFGTRSATDPAFPIEIKLQRPFYWDPALHPYLTVDIAVSSRQGNPIQIETTSGLTIDNARLTANSPTSTTGTTQQLAFVMAIGGEQANGLAVNYGTGCAGINGTPTCTSVGLPCLPNPDFRVRVRNAPGNSLAFLLIGFGPTNSPIAGAPGCNVLHDVQVGTFGFVVTDPLGDGSLPLPLIGSPSFEGFQFRSQWILLDSTANALGITTSDAQALTLKFF